MQPGGLPSLRMRRTAILSDFVQGIAPGTDRRHRARDDVLVPPAEPQMDSPVVEHAQKLVAPCAAPLTNNNALTHDYRLPRQAVDQLPMMHVLYMPDIGGATYSSVFVRISADASRRPGCCPYGTHLSAATTATQARRVRSLRCPKSVTLGPKRPKGYGDRVANVTLGPKRPKGYGGWARNPWPETPQGLRRPRRERNAWPETAQGLRSARCERNAWPETAQGLRRPRCQRSAWPETA